MNDLDKLMDKIRIAETNNSNADFHGARLHRANLRRVNLRNVDLTDADLSDANLNEADLTDANLQRANLRGANLRGAILEGVFLKGSKLMQANLIEADLTEADLTQANLTQANLTRANLSKADFTNSTIMLANLTGATLTDVINLTGAIGYSSIIHYSAQNPAPAPIDSNQVHTYAFNIDYKKINDFLRSRTKTEPIPKNYPQFIRDKFTDFISHFDESSKEKITAGLDAIIKQRLEGLNYATLSPNMRDSIFYALNYVSAQPANFQKMYAETFVQDCVRAYDGPDGMTCALGGLERILFSLLPACAGSATEDCETIVSIIEANPEKLVKEYILDWYKLHNEKGDNKFLPEYNEDKRRQNLIDFLKEKLPTSNSKWINDKVRDFAIGYEDEHFAYGGGRKKRWTRKRTKRTKRRTKRRSKRRTRRHKRK